MRNPVSLAKNSQPKLLPVVIRIIEQLDSLFVESFGASGKSLAQEVFKQWLLAGKTGPSGLRHYVYALSVQIDDPTARTRFVERAERMLLHLQSGFIS